MHRVLLEMISMHFDFYLFIMEYYNHLLMEKLEFSGRNLAVEAIVAEVKGVKASIACSIAGLQESKFRKSELEKQL